MPLDENAYHLAREELLEAFRAWNPGKAIHDYADLATDFKYSYSDGEFLTWTAQDIEELMLGWIPRKVLMPNDELGRIAGGIRDFMRFLVDTGRLGTRSDPISVLEAAVAVAGPEMARRSTDPSHFGMAKSLLGGSGTSSGDAESLFDDVFDETPTILASRPPADEQLATEQARDSKAFGRLCTLHEYFTEPRKLTNTGNLKLVDARHLIDVLDTGEEMDRFIGDRQFMTKSAAELIDLNTIVEFAKRAKVLRVYGSSLVSIKSWAADRSNPLDTTLALADLVTELGPMAFYWEGPGDEQMSVFEAAVPSIMAGLYEAPIDFDDATHRLAYLVRSLVPSSDAWGSALDSLAPFWHGIVVTALTDLGLAEWREAIVYVEYGTERRRGGLIVLTELGALWCQTRLDDYGFATPTAGSVTLDLPAEEIIEALARTLETEGPDAMLFQVMEMGEPHAVAVAIERWWVVEHAGLDDVLRSIEETIPDNKVCRAARRARFKLRNR